MLTPAQLQEITFLSRRHAPAKDWATAQISEDRRQALEELLEENLRLPSKVEISLDQLNGSVSLGQAVGK